MKKKTTGVIAGAAGVALLMGGGTFALWSDSAQVPEAAITSGNLDVAVVAPGCDVSGVEGQASTSPWHWADVSTDRQDSPHWINLSEFRIIPGDTIEGRIGIDVGLEGENMVAQLGADLGLEEGALDVLDIDVTAVTQGAEACDEVPLQDGTITLASEDNGNAAGLTTVGATAEGAADFTAVVTITFPETVANQDHVRETVDLSGAAITLNQVRTAVPGYTS